MIGFVSLYAGKLALHDLAIAIAVKTIEVIDDKFIQPLALVFSEEIDRGFDWQNRLCIFSFGWRGRLAWSLHIEKYNRHLLKCLVAPHHPSRRIRIERVLRRIVEFNFDINRFYIVQQMLVGELIGVLPVEIVSGHFDH